MMQMTGTLAVLVGSTIPSGSIGQAVDKDGKRLPIMFQANMTLERDDLVLLNYYGETLEVERGGRRVFPAS